MDEPEYLIPNFICARNELIWIFFSLSFDEYSLHVYTMYEYIKEWYIKWFTHKSNKYIQNIYVDFDDSFQHV